MCSGNKEESLVTNVVTCEVSGTCINVLIDSGYSCNIISEQIWKKNQNYLRKKGKWSILKYICILLQFFTLLLSHIK